MSRKATCCLAPFIGHGSGIYVACRPRLAHPGRFQGTLAGFDGHASMTIIAGCMILMVLIALLIIAATKPLV